MNNRKQILIILGGIALAILLILSNIKSESFDSDMTPTTQKKPKQTAPALFDSLL
ncbi:hypothetical protein [Ekhidna sp.]|uniref:hypothetical protein n=1 Tax=Ekhidna sp. TaxID=2608089 RepID=UPI00329840A0